jgi:hypothetical protein
LIINLAIISKMVATGSCNVHLLCQLDVCS